MSTSSIIIMVVSSVACAAWVFVVHHFLKDSGNDGQH
jgi:hypothetical protein